MTTLPISTNLHTLSSTRSTFGLKYFLPISSCRKKIAFLCKNELKVDVFKQECSFLRGRKETNGVFKFGKKRRGGLVMAQGLRFNGGGGGGDGGGGRKILWNIGLAIGLTYLSVNGQLGWIFDAIVSISVFAVILPFAAVAGATAFLWWAGRNVIQTSCPNCGNEFQVFKSDLKTLQICPNCTQPFTVEGNEFIKESGTSRFNGSTTFGQAFNGFSRSSKKGPRSSVSVVDIEAEVKDVD